MKRSILAAAVAVLAVLALAGTATAAGRPAAATPSAADVAYVTGAIQGDLFEIQSGQLAWFNAGTPQVRGFGKMLVYDHSRTLRVHRALANRLGITPPTAPNAAQLTVLQQLSTLSGLVFDRAFVAAQVTAHQQAIQMAITEIQTGSVFGVRLTAALDLPVLLEHLQMAQALATALG
jgi:putative membrane protein